MDLIIRGKKIKDNVRCTEGSSPIVSLFPTTEFYNSAVTAVSYTHLQIGLSNAIRDKQITLVKLYKALGGGW